MAEFIDIEKAAKAALISDLKAGVKAVTKVIEVVSLRAVYGLLIHPGDETRFDIGHGKDHVIDSWCKVQMEAGKLEVAPETK